MRVSIARTRALLALLAWSGAAAVVATAGGCADLLGIESHGLSADAGDAGGTGEAAPPSDGSAGMDRADGTGGPSGDGSAGTDGADGAGGEPPNDGSAGMDGADGTGGGLPNDGSNATDGCVLQDGGACGPQCVIEGGMYPPDAANPMNACQTCQPAVSTTAFTNAPQGATCGTASVCNAAGVCGCPEGAKQCLFNGVQTCTSGTWGTAITCPYTTPNCSQGVCGTPPSCQTSGNGTTNCNSYESCCLSAEVPPGMFDRTYTNDGGGATGLADLANVSGFRLDKYLVTVGRFRQYVNYVTSSSGAPPPNGSGKHVHLNGGQGLHNTGSGVTYETGWDTSWNTNIPVGPSAVSTWNANLTSSMAYDSPAFATWTPSPMGNENLPINVMTWYEAYAFCIWDGGFLPSEAEWEYVAAGGSEQREYPWGSTDPGTSNTYAIYGCLYPTSTTPTCTGVKNIAPVGTPGQGGGKWGQLDMAGGLYEWILDWLAPFVDPCTDCASLTPTSYQVLHGGYWESQPPSIVPPNRATYSLAATRDTAVGFRCARAP